MFTLFGLHMISFLIKINYHMSLSSDTFNKIKPYMLYYIYTSTTSHHLQCETIKKSLKTLSIDTIHQCFGQDHKS